MSAKIEIRQATDADRSAIWRILEPTIRAGETYTLPRSMSEYDALAYWLAPHHEVFVACAGGDVAATYYLRANQPAGGSHVANCGYATSQEFARHGMARAMCRHSLQLAGERGFTAMQYNFVVSSNVHAIRLWRELGFEVVGNLPRAFRHPRLGLIDALVMYREIAHKGEL